ncbi:hypothetical protein B566_EDAN004010 [Ephemera danica]|nr:hypothetical protein B566_EDAN004010 [Ephemera danica]
MLLTANTMVKAKKIINIQLFENSPKLSDFLLVEEELPPLKDGECLCEALYLSVDPYMRGFDISGNMGNPMIGSSVAKVLESRNKDYKVGDLIVGYFGWQSHFIYNGGIITTSILRVKPYVLPDFGGLSPSLALGVLGMPGNTAYFGFLEICKPKAGETVVVNAAAGAVGTHVGQIAKIKGCRVIGFAGSDEKVKWLKDEIGFDAAYNYNSIDVDDALKEAAPKGVDCYFDNVGCEMSSKVMTHMNSFGRIAVCGAIAAYNASEPPLAPYVQGSMIYKNLCMEGFVVYRWEDRWMEGVEQNLKWIKEGKLKYKETITKGFEKTPEAFISMLHGGNIGKAIGEPKESDFKLIEEEVPAVKEGDPELFLGKSCWDLALRMLESKHKDYAVGDLVLGYFGWQTRNVQHGDKDAGGSKPYKLPSFAPLSSSLALGVLGMPGVLESKHKDYAVGDLVLGYFGWQTRNVQHGDKDAGGSKPYKLPSFAPLSSSLALGVLGMPGNTAYFGLTEICQPKEGETVVVNAAAGCRVIGFAGSDDKVKWLKEEIGFDAAYNYKKIDVSVALQEAAPKGVDCYFDNVGGVMSNKVMEQMNVGGRIAVCGAICSYNDDKATAPIVQRLMIYKNLKMEGFVVSKWGDRWMEGIQQNMKWIKEGKLKFRETMTEGFTNMPKAFISMLRGENTGKSVIKA